VKLLLPLFLPNGNYTQEVCEIVAITNSGTADVVTCVKKGMTSVMQNDALQCSRCLFLAHLPNKQRVAENCQSRIEEWLNSGHAFILIHV
jgi:hypothetical protein